jgi:hypothetical protein
MTVTDLVYRSAKLLTDEHGADARWIAARRSDDFLEQGDVEVKRLGYES